MKSKWQIGDTLEGLWEIREILRGGMGIIYVVYDKREGEVLAGKTFQDEVFARSPVVAERFTQEANAWINLGRHENVVEAKILANVQGKPLLFLDYVAGGDLSRWIGSPRLLNDLPQALHFAIQFCDGMNHILANGIRAHRDIKPQNCLITDDGTLKVTDFGLVKLLEDVPLLEPAEATDAGGGADGENNPGGNLTAIRPGNLSLGMTRTGVAAGTPTHMAPEQFDDAKHVDVRADVYSFGVMLFQLVTGRLPFLGNSWSAFQQLHQTEKPPPLDRPLPGLDQIIQRCLAKEPAQRFASFTELRGRLAEVYEGLTGQKSPAVKVGAVSTTMLWKRKAANLKNLGKYEQALACCERLLELDPLDEDGWPLKGILLRQLGRFQPALEACEHAIQLNAENAMGWHAKGKTLAAMNQHQDGLLCYARALELVPRYIDAWIDSGLSLVELQQFEAARKYFEQALELDPYFGPTWMYKGMVLVQLSRVAEGLVAYDQALERNPRLAEAWKKKAFALRDLGRRQEALVCWTRALELAPGDAEAWANAGMEFLQTAIDQHTGTFDPDRLQKALSHLREGHRLGYAAAAEPIAFCENIINSPKRDEATACYRKAQELAKAGRQEEAMVWLDKALAHDPSLLLAWRFKGTLLYRLQRIDEGLACFERALEFAPSDEPTLLIKAVVLRDLGRGPEALAGWDRLLEVNPKHPEAWSEKGIMLLNLQRFDEALVCLDRALEVNRRSSHAWFGKGMVLAIKGDWRQALACFEEAALLGHSQAGQHAALCRQQLNRP